MLRLLLLVFRKFMEGSKKNEIGAKWERQRKIPNKSNSNLKETGETSVFATVIIKIKQFTLKY